MWNFIFTNILEPIIDMIKKHGVGKTFVSILIVFYILVSSIRIFHLEPMIQAGIQKYNQTEIETHDKAVEKRYQNSPKIDKILNEVLYRYNADRVCIVEMHNGNKNVAGLPFIYGEMTYEICREGIIPVDADYTKFNLSRLSFPTFMMEHNAYCGDITSLSSIDEKFAERLMVNNSTFLCGYTLHGEDNVIGYFGVIWCGDKPVEIKEMMRDLSVYAQRIAVLLDEN